MSTAIHHLSSHFGEFRLSKERMEREELKSGRWPTAADAIFQSPVSGLKILVVGARTLLPTTLETLRDHGLGVQTVTLDRFRLAAETYGPDVIVCSERCLRTGLRNEISMSSTTYAVVVLQHERGSLALETRDLPGQLVVISSDLCPLQIAEMLKTAAERSRRSSVTSLKPATAPTLPSGRRSGDSSPPPSATPNDSALGIVAPNNAPEEDPTHPYASRGFCSDEVTPPSSYSMAARHTSQTPSAPPTSVRLPFSSRGHHLSGVRVALLDVDPTRADALAVALRARRAEVHIASLHVDQAHFRLLRKFAPHALLLDEDVLSGEGREFLRRFREDPFLQHTQLLALRLERLFRIRSGTASIESIKDLLEPLGRAETALLSQLGPGVEVEFDLDQVPPHRLIKMLATRSAPTTISCTREKETFKWTVVGGKTGRATLYHSAHKEPCILSPEEALDWLLSHQNCHVVLLQPSDFDDTTGREVVPLLESKESGLWQFPMWASPHSPHHEQTRQGKQPDSLGPVSVRFRANSLFPIGNILGGLRTKWAVFIGGAMVALGAILSLVYASNHQDRTAVPPPPVPSPQPAAAREVARDAVGENDIRPAHDVDAPLPLQKNGADADALFLVASVEDPPCETIVDPWNRPRTDQNGWSNLHFRNAQKLLVEGHSGEAHRELCKSALLNSSGKGAELLAQYALGERVTQKAERWVKEVLKARPEDTQALTLLGDVLHQKGSRDEALETWLSALDVAPEDMAKRKAVARVWVGHSRRALETSDYPRAERNLRRALAFDASNAEAASLMAVVFRRRKIDDGARAWEAEATRLTGLN